MKQLILKGVNLNHFPEVLPVSDHRIQLTLAPNEQQIVHVPDDSRYVILNSDSDFYLGYDNNVTLPTGEIGQVITTSDFNPSQRFIAEFKTLRFKSSNSVNIHIAFYS